MKWVESFRITWTVNKKKSPGPKRTVTTPGKMSLINEKLLQ